MTNPQQISEKFNSFFIETIENLKKVNNIDYSTSILPTNPVYYNTMFVSPVPDYEQIADTFNNYFISIANTVSATVTNDKNETSTNKIYLKYLNNSFKKPFSKIKWNYVTTYEVTKIIKSVKEKKACGYDEVPIKILKLSAPYIISPITYIYEINHLSRVFFPTD
jgi:hypothetical protein